MRNELSFATKLSPATINYSIASNDQDGVLEALNWMLKDKKMCSE